MSTEKGRRQRLRVTTGVAEVGAQRVSAGDFGTTQIGSDQESAAQVRVAQVLAPQVRADQVGTRRLGGQCHRRRRLAAPRLRTHPAQGGEHPGGPTVRSEEHTSELQSLMRISYAVFCLKKKNTQLVTYINA